MALTIITPDIFSIQTFYQTITANITIIASNNALSAGPITIADGVTVTIEDGATWTIV